MSNDSREGRAQRERNDRGAQVDGGTENSENGKKLKRRVGTFSSAETNPMYGCRGIRTRESGGSGKRDSVPFRARDKGFVVPPFVVPAAALRRHVCRTAGPALPFSINLLLSRRLHLGSL